MNAKERDDAQKRLETYDKLKAEHDAVARTLDVVLNGSEPLAIYASLRDMCDGMLASKTHRDEPIVLSYGGAILPQTVESYKARMREAAVLFFREVMAARQSEMEQL